MFYFVQSLTWYAYFEEPLVRSKSRGQRRLVNGQTDLKYWHILICRFDLNIVNLLFYNFHRMLKNSSCYYLRLIPGFPALVSLYKACKDCDGLTWFIDRDSMHLQEKSHNAEFGRSHMQSKYAAKQNSHMRKIWDFIGHL